MLNRFLEMSDADPIDREERLKLVIRNLQLFTRQLKNTNWEPLVPRILAEAESIYAGYAEEYPQQGLMLAQFMAQEGRRTDGIELAKKASISAQPDDIAATVGALLGGGLASREEIKQVEDILSAALAKHEQSTQLLLAMADVRTYQKRFDDAEALFREVIDQSSNDVSALNNLAILLALKRTNLDEPLPLIQRAIGVAGPLPTLLDSRATVCLALSKPDRALADLKAATADASEPVFFFHLAQTYFQIGQKEAAGKALAKALELELVPQQLHPLERPAYDQLLDVLK